MRPVMHVHKCVLREHPPAQLRLAARVVLGGNKYPSPRHEIGVGLTLARLDQFDPAFCEFHSVSD
jgi:hypothetical protein